MNSLESPVRSKAAVTYDAAADHFDEAPLAFWDRHGRHAVERLRLRAGRTCSGRRLRHRSLGASRKPRRGSDGPRHWYRCRGKHAEARPR